MILLLWQCLNVWRHSYCVIPERVQTFSYIQGMPHNKLFSKLRLRSVGVLYSFVASSLLITAHIFISFLLFNVFNLYYNFLKMKILLRSFFIFEISVYCSTFLTLLYCIPQSCLFALLLFSSSIM